MKDEMTVQAQKQEFRAFLTRKSLSLFLVVCMLCVGIVAVSADEITVVTSADWQSVIDTLTTQINVATIVAVLVAIAGVCVGLVFMWWGVRKATHALMAAFRKGKISI